VPQHKSTEFNFGLNIGSVDHTTKVKIKCCGETEIKSVLTNIEKAKESYQNAVDENQKELDAAMKAKEKNLEVVSEPIIEAIYLAHALRANQVGGTKAGDIEYILASVASSKGITGQIMTDPSVLSALNISSSDSPVVGFTVAKRSAFNNAVRNVITKVVKEQIEKGIFTL
jgi:hypothetical protein